MQNILVTGGAGFIGSNFILYFLERYKNYKIINLDALTYAADLQNLSNIKDNVRYEFIKGDIGDKRLVSGIFTDYNIKGVINFAAESHVDNSILNPEKFLQTNIMGTFNLLDVAYKYWMSDNFVYKDEFKNCRFHHISTDEVYGSLGEVGLFTETTSYAPNSPYSASKAGSDFLIRSYFKTFGLNVTTSNCSNNYGPRQHKEKLIPKLIDLALAGKDVTIYGDGKNVRDWLHVKDHCSAIDLIFHKGVAGDVYNVGGNNEKNNLEVVDIVLSILDSLFPRKDKLSYKNQIVFVKDRAGHDRRYAIDATKIKNDLKWVPEFDFSSGIKSTIQWYLHEKILVS
jgi:dTDP-glucose 4,6-dehydratase